MFFAYDNTRVRTNIYRATKGKKYYCPCCNAELILKRGEVNQWHFAHKSLSNCDNWYEENEWKSEWLEKFKPEHREIVVFNEVLNKRRFADVKIDSFVIQFIPRSLNGNDVEERINFFNKDNDLVWIVDLRDKDISYKQANKTAKTIHFTWNRAWKFNLMDKYSMNFKLFFQITDNKFIQVIWNKEGFKYFGGYVYNKDQLMDYLRALYRKSVRRIR